MTQDPTLRKVLQRTLSAVGTQVSFVDDCADVVIPPGPSQPDARLVVVVFADQAARRQPSWASLLLRAGDSAKVVVLGEPLDAGPSLDLLEHPPCDNVIGHDEQPADEDELVVTGSKLAHPEDGIFGLEKYLAWGVNVHEHQVRTYDEKRRVVLECAAFAKEVGARNQLVARIEAVADELLMNALYDAPASRNASLRGELLGKARPGGGPVSSATAVFRFAHDGKHFALSARDSFGTLKKGAIIEHLARARLEQGSPLQATGGGAGLGLYFVLASSSRLIVNVEPDRSTEVICLFDLRVKTKDAKGARSLHIFTGKDAPKA